MPTTQDEEATFSLQQPSRQGDLLPPSIEGRTGNDITDNQLSERGKVFTQQFCRCARVLRVRVRPKLASLVARTRGYPGAAGGRGAHRI